MDDQLTAINTSESVKHQSKYSRFAESTKRTMGKLLTRAGIGLNTMLPMASTTTSTVVPASVNTISVVAPTAFTMAKAISLGTAASLLTACGPDDPETKDTTPPTININKPEVDITGGKEIRVSGNQLYIGSELVASRNDNKTKNCKVALSINGNDVSSGTTIYEDGTLTIKVSDETGNIRSTNIKLNNKEYKMIEIINIQPVEILPIIGQIETGDKEAYEHIEHLRVAEATRIRDMMREYGAGNYTAEEYKQLMNRLNTGMTQEMPSGYNNYENVGKGQGAGNTSEHAHTERSILCSLIEHANFKIVRENSEKNRQTNLIDFIQKNPNSINIFGCSAYTTANNKNDYDKRLNDQSIKDLCKSKNFIIFAAGTNIELPEGQLRNRIYNGEYETNEYGEYSLASLANSDKNTQPNSHLLVTIATDADGDIDQTGETIESSKYPVGFHDNILFSGRAFPYQSSNGKISAEGGNKNHGKYSTSLTTYFNVAMADLCFQMKADITDTDQLLEMIRSSSLTDYIRLDEETQKLQLINPAGFFKEYLMPNDLPNNLKSDKTAYLNKGFYKGVIFNIPGAEVKINGEWITYNTINKSLIKSQNPMTLEWRINGDRCKKLGYQGKSMQGKIIVVDDKWNGLNIDKDFSINIE